MCLKNGLAISNAQCDQLALFANKISQWNQKINLISRRDEKNIWRRHILSSIAICFLRKFYQNSYIVDIGTGGGFPGIPMAIFQPTMNFLLIDSIQKKIRALQEILSELHLKNVSAICGRAEDLGTRKEYQKNFDYVVCRAVGRTKDILVWGKPFLKEVNLDPIATSSQNDSSLLLPGSIILLKGGALTEEIDEVIVKCKPRRIEIIPVSFKGNESSDLIDKKIVIVQP